MVLTVSATAEIEQYTFEQLLDELLSGIRDRRKDWTQTVAEKGSINGLISLRARWSGRSAPGDVPMRGFVYVTKADGTVFQLSSQDLDSHEEGLTLAEASILTFVRTPKHGLQKNRQAREQAWNLN